MVKLFLRLKLSLFGYAFFSEMDGYRIPAV